MLESESTDPKGFYKAWLRINRRSLPYLIIAPAMLAIGEIALLFQKEYAGHVFNLETIITLFELIFTPLMAINFVFFANRIINRTAFPFWRQILLKLAFCVAGLIIGTFIIEVLAELNGTPDDDDQIVMGSFQLSPSMTNYVSNVFVGIAIALPLFFIQERRKRLEHKLESKNMELQRLERLQAQSRLEALQSQLNPHFLYNALNTLTSLVYKDPGRAEKVILGLSDLFRYSLQKDDRILVSLAEEIDIVKTYLDIETIRFEDSLSYTLDIDEKLLVWQVPRFLLQPLVENAIKHGTSRIPKGHIHVRIFSEKEGELKLSVADNGAPFAEQIELGFGLGSTIEKLNILYPEKHEIHWSNQPVKSVNILLKGTYEPA